jgi:hypothetical protein
MASSLLDRIKRQPQSAETFIAAADATAPSAPIPVVPPLPINSDVTTAVPEATENAGDPISKIRSTQRKRRAPSEDPRKYDVPRYTFNLRLNDYELELLRSLADEQRESMQKIVKNGLIPYLEELRKRVINS